MQSIRYFSLISFASACLVVHGAGTAAADRLRFNRDVRPILAANCFACHGQDANSRKGALRLDQREPAVAAAESGERAIVPRKPDESELVRRILSDEAGEVMPPKGSGKSLTAAQKELLRRWIAEGAEYEAHWAFIPAARPPLPPVARQSWPRNPVDTFVLARIEREGLAPSPEADPATLLRRLSLDLTGLPPGPDDAAAFVSEMRSAADPDAVYDQWVDRLLSSPQFGERMAVDWLDAARFADTNGYQVDRDREGYAWRDWVIAAFNDNMPFDQFTIEQLAGDLLPGATLSQKIATGFHRNHMLNEEGGIIPEEFLAEYCADRVETTAAVWLGQTFNCARCHDHKFDPFTQRDFYGLYAFFHNVTEKGIGNYGANIRRNAPPMIKLPAPEHEARLASLKQQLGETKVRLAGIEKSLAVVQAEWESRVRDASISWSAADPLAARSGDAGLPVDAERRSFRAQAREPETPPVTVDVRLPSATTTALRLEFSVAADPNSAANAANADQPSTVVSLPLAGLRLFRKTRAKSEGQPLKVRAAEADGSLALAQVEKVLDADAKSRATLTIRKDAPASLIVELDPAQFEEPPGAVALELSFPAKEAMPAWELRVSATAASVDLLAPADILSLVRKDVAARTPDEQKRLNAYHNSKDGEFRGLNERVAALDKQIDETDLQIPTALVMEELPAPRTTRILIRGAYDKPGDEVTAATPATLPAMSADLPRNRLGLARWLVDPANPLTARVIVSRYWQSLFGTGLVRTSEDFGTQGEPPTNPELLDWLATEFVRTGWDVKGMLRLLVTSSTYRQSSRFTPELRDRDPDNRLLARGPRFRLQAEFLRDQALAAGGLLVSRIGGPSVRPYHPPGLYEQVVSGSSANTYVVGKGDELYRRSLYTYWKRSVPNPAMLAFDAPFRETCVLRRARTNTPLQALNLMNDPTFVEAARGLAQRMVREAGDAPTDRIAHGFRIVLARPPQTRELSVLVAAYERAMQEFEANPAAATELLKVGESPALATIPASTLAALTTVANTLLNLDEAVTRE